MLQRGWRAIQQRAVKPPQWTLRRRLVLSYGGLLALALAVFSVLVLVLSADAIGQSVDDAVRAEAHIALHDLSGKLSAAPPYWPAQLTLSAVDAYQEPGITVAVLDAEGHIRYESEADTSAIRPSNGAVTRTVIAGDEAWYTTTANRERVRVGAFPIHAISASGTDGGVQAGPVIGVLLVAKALGDIDATQRLLGLLLLLVGGLTLLGAGAAAWFIAARVLAPITLVTETARAIAAGTTGGSSTGDLSRRVHRPGGVGETGAEAKGEDELAQLVDTFNEMLAALERLVNAQQRFVADASHELRAPLTTMQGNLAILQRDRGELPPDERAVMLHDAYAETLRLARLVDDLLLLARQEAQPGSATAALPSATAGGPLHGEIAPSVTEFDRVVLQLVRQLRGRLAIDESRVTLQIGRMEPVRVHADEGSLRRIALILLDNAIKYTTTSAEVEGGRPPRVTVSLERVGNIAILRVSDTGIGIEPADLPHIFERFYRADRARDRRGTGLGLAIARVLVERLRGQIEAESVLGEGSTFTVRLPAVGSETHPSEPV